MKGSGIKIFGTLFPTGIPRIPDSIDKDSFAEYVKAVVKHYKGAGCLLELNVLATSF